MTDHPYVKYDGTAAWKAIYAALEQLVLNDDIQEQTPREYIVGYIIKSLANAGVAIGVERT
jgi:hypothetical protein